MRVLDIGCGSGLLSLMIAQRSDAMIDAVEIDSDCAEQARENAGNSPYHQRIKVVNQRIQEFESEEKYDLIITNPPYFINSLLPPDSRRHQTRHTTTLSHEELVAAVLRLLVDHGRFNVVLPPAEAERFLSSASGQLHCHRHWTMRSKLSKPVERHLMEMRRSQASAIETDEIILYDHDNTFSAQYRELTSAFYLHF